ncbi:MAG: UDP-2,3-diacylglucosamine diphosphatase [Gammaproteobacteria bacterium]|jgi:UDP-2,3-diacylglucosamine hydrolase|nr:UDP-2,3-diacylglucosamine diphosphatase [Gammaproteobacteria bacterium]MBT4462159.1 UDP-2,3-diacylglucosamine diphosphatase [Gammaproteobacteria bacterium]MBT4655018.1 UDP-2,3-diacylglucosamine diphosphatase [Gammaproteobacteria bacterium]MBT5116468.1 UDP-2,3-diacylglucosamine diphosphatase [Gammaproteobacteria bacterium]MBT5761130.1 UDP-2,3-diacylglucosamine diphosphatase [Gammaproteobacteria bacterium]
MTSLFISDLHLDKERPQVIKFFNNLLDNLDADIDSLYILGDFVEFWVGDDDPAYGLEDVFKNIKSISRKIDVYFMHGNRDFMISKSFCINSGMKLLDDPTIINLYDKKILLMHGDTLCTDDFKYQEFRTMVRSKSWQNEILKKSLSDRISIAKMFRAKSLQETDAKNEIIMDVNEEEVIRIIKKYHVDMIIHGHTHRPNIHQLTIDGKKCKRIVLGDWYDKSFVLKISENKTTIDKANLS